jgi:DNA invertase Pin-like site-specific DNA recombinase
VYRSSQGDEKKIGLDIQHEEVPELADNLGATITREVDLGIHTGFSSFVRDPGSDNRLDAHPEIQQLLEELKTGEYDYLLAYDDTRLARDDFFFVIHYACIVGNCTIAFVDRTDLDSLEFRVRRVVEQHVKQTEIRNSKEARQRRREQGGREGTPPIGMQWDDDRHGWIPDDDFEDVLEIIAMKDGGATHRETVSASSIISSTGTVTKILNRRDEYESAMLDHQ